MFLATFLDSFLQLAQDAVPNIRMAVARLCQQSYPKWLNTDARVHAALAAMKADDPDLAGELLDCLKCLGEGGTPHALQAERFLVARQCATLSFRPPVILSHPPLPVCFLRPLTLASPLDIQISRRRRVGM